MAQQTELTESCADQSPSPMLLLDTPQLAQRVLIDTALQPAGRMAWLRTCTAGRDQVLAHAPLMTLYVKGTSEEQQALQQALRRRGSGPSKLQATRSCTETGFISSLNAATREVQHDITAADLGHLRLTGDLQKELAGSCPNMQWLHADMLQRSPLCQLPRITALSLGYLQPSHIALLQPCLHQLVSLTLHELECPRTLKQLLRSMLPNLTALHLPSTPLSKTLVFLLHRAPALEQLTVASFDLSLLQAVLTPGATSAYPATWKLRDLHTGILQVQDALQALPLLPTATSGLITIHLLHNVLVLRPDLVHLVQSSELLSRLTSSRVVGPAGQRLAVTVASNFRNSRGHLLPFLSALQPQEVAVHCSLSLGPSQLQTLSGMRHTTGMSLTAAEWCVEPDIPVGDLPCVQGLRVLTLEECDLSDRVLEVLLHCASNLEELTVNSISLVGIQHQQCKWQLRQLTVDSQPLSLRQVAKLPQTAGLTLYHRGPVVCEVLPEQAAQDLCQRLKDLQLSCTVFLLLQPSPRVASSDHPAALRSTLSALSNAHLHSPTVRLQGWEMSAEVLQVLAGLPAKEQLVFTGCTWPLPLEQYKPLLSLLPHTYSKLEVQGSRAAKVIEAVCQGVLPEGCSAKRPAPHMLALV